MNHLNPFVGASVIYYAYGSVGGKFKEAEPRAAIVTEVHSPGTPNSPVGLCVLNPAGQWFNNPVVYAPGEPGCWGWNPEKPEG